MGGASGRGTEQQKHVFEPETPDLKDPQLEAQVQEEVAGFEGKRLGLHKEGTDEHKGAGEHGGPKGPEPTRYAPVVRIRWARWPYSSQTQQRATRQANDE